MNIQVEVDGFETIFLKEICCTSVNTKGLKNRILCLYTNTEVFEVFVGVIRTVNANGKLANLSRSYCANECGSNYKHEFFHNE